ncbi:L-dopachrome tautomerase yellow-f2-like [Bombyx mandarina]|uniref:L-dopachrome tautomerase yellow-f2-like n=1 Tax=Bombyx mandarina TaxID=7092 RepID=A0A6J2JWH1_BOMMA|nr:L-dopachrome tautomerase yellow-f2-like [Bombyx mandarina]
MFIKIYFLINSIVLFNQIYCVYFQFERENHWNLFGYDIDGVKYTSDSDYEQKVGAIHFENEALKDHEKFLIQKNLVPYGTVYFFYDQIVTIPRTRPGIPFTVNIMNTLNHRKNNYSPLLSPFPNTQEAKNIVSVYDIVIDGCRRLWMVDTGFNDVPGDRRQIQAPTVTILLVSINKYVVYQKIRIDPEVLRNGVTSGLRTIAIDYILPCSETFMYINDDSSNAVIVFSLRNKSFQRIVRSNANDEAWSFPVPKSIVNYMTNVVRYRQPPNETFIQYSDLLKTTIADREKLRSDAELSEPKANPRGVLYERNVDSNVLFFTNEERTLLFCWNADTPMVEENVALLTDISSNNDFYISGMETSGYVFKFLVNRIRNIDNNIYNEQAINFANYKVLVLEMLQNTTCSARTECSNFLDQWNKESSNYVMSDIKYYAKYITDEFKSDWKRDVEAIWAQL